MKEKIRVDYLPNHKDYKVVQHLDMYHFNTDTALLGEFININENEQVLDVGTNNGALLVYIIKKGGIASGIEINSSALKICQMTLNVNNIKANLINDDFSIYDSNKFYDVIVCNPPYFNSVDEKEKNINEYKKIARHEGSLSLKTLCLSFKRNIKESGRIYMVYRVSRFAELEKELNENKLYISKYQYVYDEYKNEPKCVLLEASNNKCLKHKIEDRIIIH